jgi:hypothetical protein
VLGLALGSVDVRGLANGGVALRAASRGPATVAIQATFTTC